MRRLEQAPWIPNEDVWQRILFACAEQSLRNRLMVTLAYDGALRREELVQLDVGDIEHAHRLIHLRAETTKFQRAREVAFGVTRNVRTIQVLIDRESVLTGAAASGEQPWKYYDLGEGYCSYDFFAKCPHRLACARCPFYVPKTSSRGQFLAVKDGIDEMLEQLNLTDDEREALEGDREAVAALAERLSDIPTPAGPTPKELGATKSFIPLTQLTER
ncbi:tyrosine-type recombinase/integrase [Streptomyces maoxianensis]|uniref:Tyrosine-type recombinase/integrase n=1 Tax=Streptomyces maoxianensis TaxID=1459942 RepID=A0ABV9GGH8_9ACTN